LLAIWNEIIFRVEEGTKAKGIQFLGGAEEGIKKLTNESISQGTEFTKGNQNWTLTHE